jgi:hypothetical protein
MEHGVACGIRQSGNDHDQMLWPRQTLAKTIATLTMLGLAAIEQDKMSGPPHSCPTSPMQARGEGHDRQDEGCRDRRGSARNRNGIA